MAELYEPISWADGPPSQGQVNTMYRSIFPPETLSPEVAAAYEGIYGTATHDWAANHGTPVSHPSQLTLARALELYRNGGPTRPPQSVPNRLTPQTMPANFGTMTPAQVAAIGIGADGTPGTGRPRPIMVAAAQMPPGPRARPDRPAVATLTDTVPPAARPRQAGGIFGGITAGIGNLASMAGQHVAPVMRAAGNVGQGIVRAANPLGTVAGRTAVFDTMLAQAMNGGGGYGDNMPNAGQSIMTANNGQQTIGQRLNGSNSGYTVSNSDYFNNIRGI